MLPGKRRGALMWVDCLGQVTLLLGYQDKLRQAMLLAAAERQPDSQVVVKEVD